MPIVLNAFKLIDIGIEIKTFQYISMPKIARQKAWFLPGVRRFEAQNPDGFCIENDFVHYIIIDAFPGQFVYVLISKYPCFKAAPPFCLFYPGKRESFLEAVS